ncbi:hypothetical protein K9U39_00045 [Rhodoblastus acidophilus]|uniref:Secreted protein n=1 Tax=Candidatus Rhodoblastus alkanivorans TaxID=2954117 RepID=A0ABS9Z2Z7_9HYPH|nr:hypothetical protein [Candidatus Rhodoblastus alkanivorans]MCI4677314.1 hypothetical protein [Candidatus Rhodoblastus alkanivorans]MCI4682049.1 hypothetical protein [Candidatus Rhodoblastus alkanivorans]MDI4639351.1 hypothetical protein [Rhodoblastus acidophilus]
MQKQFINSVRLVQRMKRISAIAVGALILTCNGCLAQAPHVANYPLSAVATEWLVKSVCADDANEPVAADPYFVCPSGTHRKKISVGDPLPYHNINQTRNEESDSFVLVDKKGAPLYVRDFDWGPKFNTFFNNTDGYDVYSIANGWISIAATKAGDAAGVTFFGANCTIGNGWLSFPENDFLRGGITTSAIAGVYWEQKGQTFPGACTQVTNRTTTQWELKKDVTFGGVRKNPRKTMDALISYHDFNTTPEFLQHGHMEVYYFTQQYGLTRWEFWTPAAQGRPVTSNCLAPDVVQYRDVDFNIADCQDFSNVVLSKTPDIPEWPLPQANVLAHSHFDAVSQNEAPYVWSVVPPESGQSSATWGLKNSTASADRVFNQTGIRYVSINCSRGNSCLSLSQELPVGAVHSGNYLYGVTAKTTAGDVGKIKVSVQQLDARGQVIWEDSFVGVVQSYNGSHPSATRESRSIYLSAGFLHKVAALPPRVDARTVRFVIAPEPGAQYDILEAWLNRWPQMRQHAK